MADKAQLRTSDTSNENISKVIGNITKALRDKGQGEKVPGCQGLYVAHREKRMGLDCSVSHLRFPCLAWMQAARREQGCRKHDRLDVEGTRRRFSPSIVPDAALE